MQWHSWHIINMLINTNNGPYEQTSLQVFWSFFISRKDIKRTEKSQHWPCDATVVPVCCCWWLFSSVLSVGHDCCSPWISPSMWPHGRAMKVWRLSGSRYCRYTAKYNIYKIFIVLAILFWTYQFSMCCLLIVFFGLRLVWWKLAGDKMIQVIHIQWSTDETVWTCKFCLIGVSHLLAQLSRSTDKQRVVATVIITASPFRLLPGGRHIIGLTSVLIALSKS